MSELDTKELSNMAKKTAEEIPQFYGATRRIVEGGIVYNQGDRILDSLVSYDRLVFMLARGWILSNQPLGEQMQEDVEEVRS